MINTAPGEVWTVLCDLRCMARWMGEPEMHIEVQTDWKAGRPILIRGFHHVKFEDRGTVLQFDPPQKLSYTHLSSISRLPDRPESYTTFEFTLVPEGDGTLLTLHIENFPTESILKHLDFYWGTTLLLIKKMAEEDAAGENPSTRIHP